MKKIVTSIGLVFFTFFTNAQIDKTYDALTFFSTDYLIAIQNSSRPLLIQSKGSERLIINHHLNYQKHFFLTNRFEISIGGGLNLQLYSARGQENLQNIADFLDISSQLDTKESHQELDKLRFNNVNLTFPIGLKFFLKKEPMEGAQPAFSLQFITERNIHRRINARYITNDYFLFVSRSNFSSIDTEIEQFFEKSVTKMIYSLRLGMSFQNGGSDSPVRNSSFDVHYIHYFNSFDSGITDAARGMSFAWRYQF